MTEVRRKGLKSILTYIGIILSVNFVSSVVYREIFNWYIYSAASQ